MINRKWTILNALLLCLISVEFTLIKLWNKPAIESIRNQEIAVAASRTQATLSAETPRVDSIAVNPIFFSDRRPPVTTASLPNAIPAPNEQIMDVPIGDIDISLLGTIVSDATRLAMLKLNSGRVVNYYQGDQIDGWLLSVVEPLEVTLRAGNTEKRITLERTTTNIDLRQASKSKSQSRRSTRRIAKNSTSVSTKQQSSALDKPRLTKRQREMKNTTRDIIKGLERRNAGLQPSLAADFNAGAETSSNDGAAEVAVSQGIQVETSTENLPFASSETPVDEGVERFGLKQLTRTEMRIEVDDIQTTLSQ